MFESEPRGEISRSESAEVLRNNPEKVFDSELEQAQQEFERVIERSKELSGETIRVEGAEVSFLEVEGASVPAISICWDENGTGILLIPQTEGRGFEAMVAGYTGYYGYANNENGHNQIDIDTSVPLAKLYGVPESLNLMIKPTSLRWAVGVDELAIAYGENTRTMYMGLGFLFLGEEWMYIGNHEAGHLPDTTDENEAWTKGNKYNAAYYRSHPKLQEAVRKQEHYGLFGILEKPKWYTTKPTIGDIMRYGLTSHHTKGEARLIEAWMDRINETTEEFKRHIDNADYIYRQVFE